MKIDVVMPKMGESINEGTLIKWHKTKGDKVQKDEIIFEISTDKVDTEIPSPEEGVLVDIKVFEQETVEVDTVVAVIETLKSQPVPMACFCPYLNVAIACCSKPCERNPSRFNLGIA